MPSWRCGTVHAPSPPVNSTSVKSRLVVSAPAARTRIRTLPRSATGPSPAATVCACPGWIMTSRRARHPHRAARPTPRHPRARRDRRAGARAGRPRLALPAHRDGRGPAWRLRRDGPWGARWLEIEPHHVDAAYVLWATTKLVDVDKLPDRTVVV